jgi:phage portal protein BeeE
MEHITTEPTGDFSSIQVLQTQVGNVQIAGNILLIRMREDDELTNEMVFHHKRQIQNITGGQKLGVLLDVREISLYKIPKEVIHTEFSHNDFTHQQTGLAILTTGKLVQHAIQRYILTQTPVTPTRLFVNETQALNWLKKLNNRHK